MWAGQLLRNGEAVTPIEIEGFWKLFQAIKADGAKRFSDSPAIAKPVANLDEDLSVIQQEDDVDVDVSDILFEL